MVRRGARKAGPTLCTLKETFLHDAAFHVRALERSGDWRERSIHSKEFSTHAAEDSIRAWERSVAWRQRSVHAWDESIPSRKRSHPGTTRGIGLAVPNSLKYRSPFWRAPLLRFAG